MRVPTFVGGLELEQLAAMGSAAVKVSRRDVAAVVAAGVTGATTVGRCSFTLSKPVLKAPMVSALEARI